MVAHITIVRGYAGNKSSLTELFMIIFGIFFDINRVLKYNKYIKLFGI